MLILAIHDQYYQTKKNYSMSVTHNWFAAYLTDEEHTLVLPHFTAALTKAIPRKEEEIAMEYWKENPKRLGEKDTGAS